MGHTRPQHFPVMDNSALAEKSESTSTQYEDVDDKVKCITFGRRSSEEEAGNTSKSQNREEPNVFIGSGSSSSTVNKVPRRNNEMDGAEVLLEPCLKEVKGTENRLPNDENCASNTKTFRSTEVQTDIPALNYPSRESRRRRDRVRRERRTPRTHNPCGHYHNNTNNNNNSTEDRPRTSIQYENEVDIHQFQPPPYSTLPPSTSATIQSSNLPVPLSNSSLNPPITYNSTVPLPSITAVAADPDDQRFIFPLPIRSPSERSGKGCCSRWFTVRFLIAVVALGGLSCAVSGAALGSTSSHLTAALLMIGVGIILVMISGAAWKITDSPQEFFSGNHANIFNIRARRECSRGNAPQGLLYPEYQHRPPPPTYQASMQEYRLRLLLLDRQNMSNRTAPVVPSPPPTYRSYNGRLLRVPLAVANNLMQTSIHYPGRLRAARLNGGVSEHRTSTSTSISPVVLRQIALSQKRPAGILPSNISTTTDARLGTSSDERLLFGGGQRTVGEGSGNDAEAVKKTSDATESNSNKGRSCVTVVTITGADSNFVTKSVAEQETVREADIDILAHL